MTNAEQIAALERDIAWLEEWGPKAKMIRVWCDDDELAFRTGVPESVAAMAAQKRAMVEVLKAQLKKEKAE